MTSSTVTTPLAHATGGTDRDSGGGDCGHSVEDSVVLPIFHQLFRCLPIFSWGDQFPSDGLGGFCNVKTKFA